jgi:hypothetical protein
MKTFSTKNDVVTIDGETFYHYELGGKQTSTKSVIIHGESYYNSNKPFQFEGDNR